MNVGLELTLEEYTLYQHPTRRRLKSAIQGLFFRFSALGLMDDSQTQILGPALHPLGV